ncbi:N-6 DNA methylase [Aliarcobacter butzleri]|nr:N-6 DNA methylase [Aliarcobacter butzleri]
MTKMLEYKQFFTPSKYSNIMINHLEMNEPIKVIDLAMGECSLLIEAQRKWTRSEFFGNDIDLECCQKIEKQSLNIKCFNKDIFKFNSINNILNNVGKVDLCLGNPPFYLIQQNEDTKKIISYFDSNICNKGKTVPAEIIFILQCMRILKKGGILSLILPDGFFVNKHLEYFRKFLINNYIIQKVIELPKNIFKKTEAKTHILMLKNDKPISKRIKLINQETSKEIEILDINAIERMDFSYYSCLRKSDNYKTLSDYDIEFIRGKSKYLLKEFKDSYLLHTTNFRNTNLFKSSLKTMKHLSKHLNKVAMANDIIIARVGSNCIGKVGMVESGYFLATDCVFIIRVKEKELREQIYQTLSSFEGQEWIKSHSKGVAARHITLEDIKKFPISESSF